MNPALFPHQFYSSGAKGALERLGYVNEWLVASSRYCRNAAGGPCKNGDGVATWLARDFGADQADFAQATGAAQPTFREGGKFPYLSFDGIDDYLETAVALGSSTTGALLFVARLLGSATRTAFASCDTAGTANVWAILDHATPALRVRKDDNQVTDDLWVFVDARLAQRNHPNLYSLYDLGAGWVGQVNGVGAAVSAVTGNNAGSQMWGSVTGRDNWTIGALVNSGGPSSFCNFDLYEAIWMPSTITAQRYATVLDYLRTKYRYRCVAHLGDSWAADTGYGIELREALRDDFIMVADHGVGSETMTQIGTRFDSDIDGKGYDLVIVEGAINDLKAASAGGHVAVFNEFARICNGVLADGSKLVACNCGPFGNNSGWSQVRQNELQAYNTQVFNYCKAKGVPLIDLYEFARNKDLAVQNGVVGSSQAGQPYAFRPDWELTGGLHFNAAGDSFVARHIAAVVRSVLNNAA